MRKSKNKYSRFSFNNFVPTSKGEEWSLEHICPQTPDSVESKSGQLKWCESIINEISELEKIFKEQNRSRLKKAKEVSKTLESAIDILKANDNNKTFDISQIAK